MKNIVRIKFVGLKYVINKLNYGKTIKSSKKYKVKHSIKIKYLVIIKFKIF